MKETGTQELLAEYVKNGSERAFRELVTRYLDLVYSTALRSVGGDTHCAEDISQTVFTDLARLAGRLSKEVMLGGWLHRHTCYVASTFLRGERRREARERRAVEMNAINESPDLGLAQLAPVLDAAINELDEEDRKAILLRFYERKDLRAVGQSLGSSENAAQKRVSRALDRLHSILTHRGVTLSASALAAVLAGEAVTAAPAALVTSIVSTALAGAAAGAGVSVTLVKFGTLAKLKLWFAGAVGVGIVATTLWLQHQSQLRQLEENERLRQSAAAPAQVPPAPEIAVEPDPARPRPSPVVRRPPAFARNGDSAPETAAGSPVVFAADGRKQAGPSGPAVLLGNGEAQRIRFSSTSGSKMRIEGTSTIHDWQVESSLIGGVLEVDGNFPIEPGQTAKPGTKDARADPSVMVRSLKSVDTSGRPFSDKMDEVMYERLRAEENPKILCHLTELTLKEPAKKPKFPYLFEAKGDLVIAGVTNQVTVPVNVLPLGGRKLKISGTFKVKMTDYEIDTSMASDLGIRVGDEVKLTFDWMLFDSRLIHTNLSTSSSSKH